MMSAEVLILPTANWKLETRGAAASALAVQPLRGNHKLQNPNSKPGICVICVICGYSSPVLAVYLPSVSCLSCFRGYPVRPLLLAFVSSTWTPGTEMETHHQVTKTQRNSELRMVNSERRIRVSQLSIHYSLFSQCAQRQAGQQAGRSDGRPDGTGAAMVPERR